MQYYSIGDLMWTSINRKLVLFLIIILGIGFISGCIYPYALNAGNKTVLIENISSFLQNIEAIKINYLTPHVIMLPILFISSFLVVGSLFSLFFIFYTGFVLGFIMISFILAAGFKGFLFSLIYLLLTHLVYLFFLFILLISFLRISYNVVAFIFKKNSQGKERIYVLGKRVLVTLVFIFLNDVFLYFLGDNIINVFKFLVI